MPLFGHKHNKSAERAAAHENNAGHTAATGTGTGVGTGVSAGDTDYSNRSTGDNTTGLNTTGHTGRGYDTQHNASTQQPGYGSGTNTQTGDPYANTVSHNDATITPTSHFNNGHHTGGGSHFAGKVEHAVGSLVGSQALKEKGLQKEQEAVAFKAQSAEISEAERLEKEAMLRRHRAVQQGAHPENGQLGGPTASQEYGNNFSNMGAGGGRGTGSGVGPTGPQMGGSVM